MQNLRPLRRERSVSMELMPDDTIRLTEVTSDGTENWVHVPVESVAPLAFALLNERMHGRLDAVERLKRLLADNGTAHRGS